MNDPDFGEALEALHNLQSLPALEVDHKMIGPKGTWLYDFCKDVMGYSDMMPQPHYESCYFLEGLVGDCQFNSGMQKAGIQLDPRDTFKTVIGCVALSVALITRNPNIRIGISSQNQKQSSKRVRGIRKIFESHETFIKTYGNDWVPKFREDVWNDTAFTVAKRTKNMLEPTVQGIGVGVDVTGSHFDVIIADDIVALENSYTADQREKVHGYFTSLYPHLEPGGVILVIGTRWHEDDCYGRILKAEEQRVKSGKPPKYWKLIRSCYDGPNGLMFPTKLTHEFLEHLKEEMSAKRFAANYLNKTIADSDKIFKDQYCLERDWNYYNDDPKGGVVVWGEEQIPVLNTMAWDTAGTKATTKSDEHGLTVVGMDEEENWWIHEAVGVKGTPTEVLARVISLVLAYRPEKLLIEAVGSYQLWVDDFLTALAKYRVRPPIIIEKSHGGVPKEERICLLEPLWTNRRLILKATQKGLRSQFENFSMTGSLSHDDIIDSLQMHRGEMDCPRDGARSYIVRRDVDYEALARTKRMGSKDPSPFRNIMLGRRGRR